MLGSARMISWNACKLSSILSLCLGFAGLPSWLFWDPCLTLKNQVWSHAHVIWNKFRTFLVTLQQKWHWSADKHESVQRESDVNRLFDMVTQTLMERCLEGGWVRTDAEAKVRMWEAFIIGKTHFDICRYANVHRAFCLRHHLRLLC